MRVYGYIELLPKKTNDLKNIINVTFGKDRLKVCFQDCIGCSGNDFSKVAAVHSLAPSNLIS